MPTKLTDYEDTDQLHNPSRTEHSSHTPGKASTDAGIDQLEAFANDPANATKNTDAIRQAEQANFGASQNTESDNPYNFHTDSSSTPSRTKQLLKIARRGGPAGGIIGLIFGGLFGIGVLVSPSLAIVHLKEVLTDDLNDQLAAMDVRSTHVLRAKLSDMGKGKCGLIKVRCGLKGMSDKQIDSFKKAGIEVNPVKDADGNPVRSVTGKTQIESLGFKPSDITNCTSCKDGVATIKNVNELNKLLPDSGVRSQLRHGYNPKFMAFSDAVSVKVFGKFGLSKASKLKGTSTKDLDASMDEASKSSSGSIEADAKSSDGSSPEEDKAASDYNSNSTKFAESVSSSGSLKGVFKAAGKGVGIIGAADTACTVAQTARAVESAAKIIRAAQLASYAMVFLNFADEVKAGDATPEKAAYLGNILSSVDTEKMIVDETSKINAEKQAVPVENPDYGKSGYDAQALQANFYNDAPDLNARSQAFMVGGGLVGTLATVNNTIGKLIPGSDDPETLKKTCGKIQNGAVRVGSIIVGLVVGAGTLGWSTGVSVAASVGVSLALPILQSYLSDMIAGRVVSSKTKGVDSGNAISSGAAVIMGKFSQARGMKPLKASEIEGYSKVASDVKRDYVAMETQDDKSDPFNSMKQYSFLGQFARNLLPLKQSSANGVAMLANIVPLAFKSSMPSASAVGDFNPSRFNKCNDTGYKSLKIDADIMCNVRYGLSNSELAMDTDDVIQYMYDHNHIDEEGTPSSDYQEFLDNCVDRENGWGESDDTNTSIGSECLDGSIWPDISYFRVYTMDKSVSDGMDYITPEVAAAASMAAGSFTVGSYNTLNVDGHAGTSRSVGKCGSISNDACTKLRSSRQAQIISGTGDASNPAFDIVGTQETSATQFKFLKQQLGQYDAVPSTDADIARLKQQENGAVAIFWNKAKFSKFTEGKYDAISNVASTANRGRITTPYVGLQTTTGQHVYVSSIHYPNSHFVNPSLGDRGTMIEASNKTMAWVKATAAKDPKATIIVMGDFNDNPNQKQSYCVYTQGGVLQNTFDMAKGKNPSTPCPGGPGGIDQIYASPNNDIKALGWTHAPKSGIYATASDHTPVYVTLSYPGSEATVAGGEFAWPLDVKWWKSDRADFLDAHSMRSGTFTSPYAKGIASDISRPPDGTPIHSMLAGTVYNEDTCYIGVESKVNGGTLRIAYGHSVDHKVRQGQQVTAGQVLSGIGSTCNSTGGHLHVDMSFNGKHICPQDVFLAMDKNQSPDLNALTNKGIAPCGRS